MFALSVIQRWRFSIKAWTHQQAPHPSVSHLFSVFDNSFKIQFAANPFLSYAAASCNAAASDKVVFQIPGRFLVKCISSSISPYTWKYLNNTDSNRLKCMFSCVLYLYLLSNNDTQKKNAAHVLNWKLLFVLTETCDMCRWVIALHFFFIFSHW